mgnify:CR=1 FL=1
MRSRKWTRETPESAIPAIFEMGSGGGAVPNGRVRHGYFLARKSLLLEPPLSVRPHKCHGNSN